MRAGKRVILGSIQNASGRAVGADYTNQRPRPITHPRSKNEGANMGPSEQKKFLSGHFLQNCPKFPQNDTKTTPYSHCNPIAPNKGGL